MGTQVLYAVTGIILARELSQEAFGLVGAVLVFQAFASLLVDSGFSYALIQRKQPSRLDYSTVLWFNLTVAAVLYVVLYFCAPLIADCFQGDKELIPLSRVMFVSLVLNASAIVQTNILMKKMDVRMVALSNFVGLACGGVVGMWLAYAGYGAWAVVWQTIVLSGVKSLLLWTTGHWLPMLRFSFRSLRSFVGIGSKMMFTSFLNTLFLNIYSFFIGNRVGLVSLGYYSQSDKWSKMGITSVTQVLTSSFLPALSSVQDDIDRFRTMMRKMSRFTAYLMFPFIVGLMVVATPLFHTLFGDKWDPSIVLFRLLLLRGLMMVLNSLYTNYMLALGRARPIVRLEVLRDALALIALAMTFPCMAMTLPDDPVYGLTVMLWGQVAATAVTWIVTLIVTSRTTGVGPMCLVSDIMPYFAMTAVIVPLMIAVGYCFDSDILTLAVEILVGAGLYIGANAVMDSRIQKDVFCFIRGKKAL